MTPEQIDRIVQRLDDLGISARKASLEATGNPDFLRNFFSGKAQYPRGDNLQRIAAVLKVTPQWIMHGTDEVPASPLTEGTPVHEIDVRAGAGGGGQVVPAWTHDGEGNSVEVDNVTATWSIPPTYLRGELRVDPRRIYIIEVLGDSMLPTLHSGDRAMVDTSHTMPSPPGVYALHDGYGLIVKRLELVPGTDPQRVLVISDNQHHRERELTLDEINIVGRVVARVSAM